MATREDRCLIIRSGIAALEESASSKQRIAAVPASWANEQRAQQTLEGRVVFAIVEVRRRALQRLQHNHFTLSIHVELLEIGVGERIVGIE
jgi:hypothetical protein